VETSAGTGEKSMNPHYFEIWKDGKVVKVISVSAITRSLARLQAIRQAIKEFGEISGIYEI